MIWAQIKEFFGFAATHPQLMGVALLLVGYFVKKSRVKVLRPGITPGRDFRADPDDPRFADWFVELEGLDFTIFRVGFGQLYSSVGQGTIVSGVWNLFTTLFPQLLANLDKIKADITLGDLLLAGGAAGLLTPALSGLIPKL